MTKKRSYTIPSTKVTGPKRDDESLVDYNLRCFRRKRSSMVNREFSFDGKDGRYQIFTRKEGSFYHVSLMCVRVKASEDGNYLRPFITILSKSGALETRRDMDRESEKHIKERS